MSLPFFREAAVCHRSNASCKLRLTLMPFVLIPFFSYEEFNAMGETFIVDCPTCKAKVAAEVDGVAL